MTLRLILGNKNFSSWSLRAWVGLRHAGIPFEEEVIMLDHPETAENIRRYSPTGRVPVLLEDRSDGDLVLPESIAILEYVNECHAGGRLLPDEARPRALAIAAAAEMHAGFPALRQMLPMNLSRPPGPFTHPEFSIGPEVQEDITRVLSLWTGLLDNFGGPFLCGEFSIADAMFLPVASRLRTYSIDCAPFPLAMAYMNRVLALPAFLEWEAAARKETEILPQYDR